MSCERTYINNVARAGCIGVVLVNRSVAEAFRGQMFVKITESLHLHTHKLPEHKDTRVSCEVTLPHHLIDGSHVDYSSILEHVSIPAKGAGSTRINQRNQQTHTPQ